MAILCVTRSRIRESLMDYVPKYFINLTILNGVVTAVVQVSMQLNRAAVLRSRDRHETDNRRSRSREIGLGHNTAVPRHSRILQVQ